MTFLMKHHGLVPRSIRYTAIRFHVIIQISFDEVVISFLRLPSMMSLIERRSEDVPRKIGGLSDLPFDYRRFIFEGYGMRFFTVPRVEIVKQCVPLFLFVLYPFKRESTIINRASSVGSCGADRYARNEHGRSRARVLSLTVRGST